MRFPIGTRVRVSLHTAGLDSGRRGTIVSKREVPTDHRCVPRLGQGHYTPLAHDDYAIRDDSGDLFTMNFRYLEKEA